MGIETSHFIAVSIGAIVVAFISLVALFNGILGGLGSYIGMDYLSLQWILGKFVYNQRYFIGILFEGFVFCFLYQYLPH